MEQYDYQKDLEICTFKEALDISKNHKKRDNKETLKLYVTIQYALTLIIEQNEKEKEKEALAFVVKVYEPFIKKVASKIYNMIVPIEEYEDALQETYVMFLNLVYNYKEDIASFSYYIKQMLPQHMYAWVVKKKKTPFPVTTDIVETSITHPQVTTENESFDYLTCCILEKEYINFIKKRAVKSARTKTVYHVCYGYFLDRKSCSDLSKELGITYHAVYEVVNKIKRELVEFFNNSIYTDYISSSTGLEKQL